MFIQSSRNLFQYYLFLLFCAGSKANTETITHKVEPVLRRNEEDGYTRTRLETLMGKWAYVMLLHKYNAKEHNVRVIEL